MAITYRDFGFCLFWGAGGGELGAGAGSGGRGAGSGGLGAGRAGSAGREGGGGGERCDAPNARGPFVPLATTSLHDPALGGIDTRDV